MSARFQMARLVPRVSEKVVQQQIVTFLPRPDHNSRKSAQTGDPPIGKGERVILTAIAQHQPESVSREQLTVLTGYRRSSRDTYLQKLRQAQLVSENSYGFHVTDAGVAVLGDAFEPLPTGDALREHWLRMLPQGEAKVLGYLTAQYPREVARETISEATEYLRSSRDTYLQKLIARRLVDTVGAGVVRASEALFG